MDIKLNISYQTIQNANSELSKTELPSPPTWQIIKSTIKEGLEIIILAVIMIFLIQVIIKTFRVDGDSMQPNLYDGQYLIVDKISYQLPFKPRAMQRGDVVVFISPTQPNNFIKRIIGLPGDTIEIRRNQILVNNQPLPNTVGARIDNRPPNHRSNEYCFRTPCSIADGEVFVMGDNRGNSNDSRNWGMLKTDRIIGRAWLSYWPPRSWGLVPNNAPTASATLSSLFN